MRRAGLGSERHEPTRVRLERGGRQQVAARERRSDRLDEAREAAGERAFGLGAGARAFGHGAGERVFGLGAGDCNRVVGPCGDAPALAELAADAAARRGDTGLPEREDLAIDLREPGRHRSAAAIRARASAPSVFTALSMMRL
jgi:hypothetical protein